MISHFLILNSRNCRSRSVFVSSENTVYNYGCVHIARTRVHVPRYHHTGEVDATHFRIYLLGRGSVALCVKGGDRVHRPHDHVHSRMIPIYTCAHAHVCPPGYDPVHGARIRAAWCIPGTGNALLGYARIQGVSMRTPAKSL